MQQWKKGMIGKNEEKIKEKLATYINLFIHIREIVY